MRLKIFTTGGTIDKIYFDAKSEFQVGEPMIDPLLKEANVTFDYEVESLLRKDSLDMTDEDRDLIAAKIEADPAERVVVTHGTDSMVDTARRLVKIPDKTIVMVGAMQPARLRSSDAVFNLGYAIAAAQLLPEGVYVAMNGHIFNPLNTRKNVAENRFENY